jgi:hypothetical protein
LDIDIEAGGYANAATQDAFCAKAICIINLICYQSGKGNHLYQAPPGTFKGPAKGGFDTRTGRCCFVRRTRPGDEVVNRIRRGSGGISGSETGEYSTLCEVQIGKSQDSFRCSLAFAV